MGFRTGKKILYESNQVLQERVAQLEMELRNSKFLNSRMAENSINPLVTTSCEYNQVLYVQDAIQASNRLIWDIPSLDLPSNKLGYLFYKMGALLFYGENNGKKTYVATFSKTGTLNGIGDLTKVTPIDFAGKPHKTGMTPVYTHGSVIVGQPCVIIEDYTGSWREDCIVPRCALNGVSIDDQSEVYRQLKIAVKLTAKKAIATIPAAGARNTAEKNIQQIFNSDTGIVTMITDGVLEQLKMFNLDTDLDIEGYIKAIDTYEKLRANFNGVHTRPTIEKKEREITQEAKDNNCLTDVYLYDSLLNAQIGCKLMEEYGIAQRAKVKLNPIFENQGKDENSDKDKSKSESGNDKNSRTGDKK